ncbi:dTDP-4-amino-4,6-dideoxygalactose transaminase [Litorilituus sediminis]|uniref:dTDP-4-amino-4,6-dideoxygalactose transaminase n=1 Tax=Litorilituus sediminis TaxID=718192 RepID=A0A4P6P737_9GAMM|nr:dTDP-4-amino-4,6-dideoxygalactose transaminase [Litorilituus sediminis]QBG35282.1 dTDP-4-amino-4,6-dideoxygalactose transaminase [Litorilituus sediminis]
MIPFNKPPYTGNEEQYLLTAARSSAMAGDGQFSKKCEQWFETTFNVNKCLLTPNCTQALEMAAILLDIQPGDEVIMPSYTFVSTANAFVLRGAKVIFVDIRQDTLNIDENKIADAITPKTKAIVVVHYAGVACEMDSIMTLANDNNIFVVEDAAQGVMSNYKGKALGTIGHLGAYSFHETKNYTSGGEGGLLLINDPEFVERAEIIREKGTNRSKFFRGMIDKYSWVDVGSSYLPSELQAAYLWGQLEKAEEINEKRLSLWNRYANNLQSLALSQHIELPTIPQGCIHNAHMFYIKVADIKIRSKFIAFLKESDIHSVFHYIPLHSAEAGLKHGIFSGSDVYTTKESERLIRLPMYFSLSLEDVDMICNKINTFFA